MPCQGWNEQWIAKLYDELDPEEDRRLTRHLEQCEACRRTLAELGASRELLRASTPHVPSSPRVVVLGASKARHPLWSFAAGLAAALLVFALGLGAGWRLLGSSGENEETTSQLLARIDADSRERAALEARVNALETRLVGVSADRTQAIPEATLATLVTKDELHQGLGDLEDRVSYQRANDVAFLLGEMNAVEWRAGKWVDETRQAVRMALQTNPSFSER